jgi:hypothetical protein
MMIFWLVLSADDHFWESSKHSAEEKGLSPQQFLLTVSFLFICHLPYLI